MGVRLDSALVQRGLLPSRERAKEAVKAGLVLVNGMPARKPGSSVDEADVLEVMGPGLRYVGRGGLKLEKALQVFDIDVTGKTCVDIGASTGGFTDCMLKAGAAKVFAVDVGHGQLAASLVQDPRVVNLEGVDARAVDSDMLGGSVQFAATDVSFISLGKILGPMAELLEAGALAVCLIKPQFEAGREHIGKRGVVRSAKVHEEVILRVLDYAKRAGLYPQAIDHSPITGPEGNIEYLLLVRKQADDTTWAKSIATEVPNTVAAAHSVHSQR